MIETATLKTIVTVLLGLCALWIFYLIVRRDFDSIVRAIVVTLLVGGAFFYLHQTKLEKISFAGVRNEIFPGRKPTWVFRVKEEQWGGHPALTYLFQDPGPRLKLELDANKRNYHIVDIGPVNEALAYVGLPPVKTGARELAAITGSLIDVNTYRWEDYSLGPLVIERGLCRSKSEVEIFHCLVSIRVRKN
jgi:hypothetical protein